MCDQDHSHSHTHTHVHEHPGEAPHAHTHVHPHVHPIIEIKDLYYAYPDGTRALCGINLDIYEGDSVALVGPSGVGKSTLIKHLNGILEGHGEILVDGLPVIPENYTKIRANIGMVFQDPDDQLFCPTLYEDVAFGPGNMEMEEDGIQARVREALGKMGLLELMDRPPHNLSFGQCKRAAMATVLSMMPRIMVFDEPTSNLDPKNEAIMSQIIRELPCTKIIISHDLPILYQICNKVAIMRDGKIERVIPMDEFITNSALLCDNGLDFTFKCECCNDPYFHRSIVNPDAA